MKPITAQASSKDKRRPLSHGSADCESSVKKNLSEKNKKQIPKIVGDKDVFCWTCHRSGNLSSCSQCPRAYHPKCGHLGKTAMEASDKWICPECDNVSRAVKGAKTAVPPVKPETLAKMLNFVIDRVKLIEGSEHFCVPVDINKWHDYRDYVIKPMDVPQLERNIEQLKYECVEEFIADFRWMVHDSYIYNSVHSGFTKIAKSMFSVAKQECEEMKNCADCYLHAYTLDEETWFIEPCTVPHILVWAQLSGFPYWPGKVMKPIGGDLLDIRFFGDHSRANVPLSSCFLYSRVMPCLFKKNSKHPKIEKGIEEAEEHVRKLKEAFGTFYYALYRVPYVPKDEKLIRKLQLPEYRGPNETPAFLSEVESMRNDKMIVDKDFQSEMKQMLAQRKVQFPVKRKSSEASPKENPKRMLVQLNTPLGPKVAVMNLSGSDSDSSPKRLFVKKSVFPLKKEIGSIPTVIQPIPKEPAVPISKPLGDSSSSCSPAIRKRLLKNSVGRQLMGARHRDLVNTYPNVSFSKLPKTSPKRPKSESVSSPRKLPLPDTSGISERSYYKCPSAVDPLGRNKLGPVISESTKNVPASVCVPSERNAVNPNVPDSPILKTSSTVIEEINRKSSDGCTSSALISDKTCDTKSAGSSLDQVCQKANESQPILPITSEVPGVNFHLLDLLNGDISSMFNCLPEILNCEGDSIDEPATENVHSENTPEVIADLHLDDGGRLKGNCESSKSDEVSETSSSQKAAIINDNVSACSSLDSMPKNVPTECQLKAPECAADVQNEVDGGVSSVHSTSEKNDSGQQLLKSLRKVYAPKKVREAESPKASPTANLSGASIVPVPSSSEKIETSVEATRSSDSSKMIASQISATTKMPTDFLKIASSMSLTSDAAPKTPPVQPPVERNKLQGVSHVGESCTLSKVQNRDTGTHQPDEKCSSSQDRSTLAKLEVANGMPVPIIIPKAEPLDATEVETTPQASQPPSSARRPTIKVVQTSSLLEKPQVKYDRSCTSSKNNLIPTFVAKRSIKDVRTLIDSKSQFISPKLRSAVAKMLEEVEEEYQSYIDKITNVVEQRLEHIETTFETDKKQLYEDFKSKLRDQMDKQITEIKRKQWCAHCGGEASFHCCWNYAYCGERCQKEDWAVHNRICTQYNMSATDPYIKVSPRFQALLEKQNVVSNPRKILLQDLIDYPIGVSISSPNKPVSAKEKNKTNVIIPPSSIKNEFAPTISIPEELPEPLPAAKSLLIAPIQQLNSGEQIKFLNGKSYPVQIMSPHPQTSQSNLFPSSLIRLEPNSNRSYYILNDKKSFQILNSSSSLPSNLTKNPKAQFAPSTIASSSKTPQSQQNTKRAMPPVKPLVPPRNQPISNISLPNPANKPSIRVIGDSEIASILSGRNRLNNYV